MLHYQLNLAGQEKPLFQLLQYLQQTLLRLNYEITEGTMGIFENLHGSGNKINAFI